MANEYDSAVEMLTNELGLAPSEAEREVEDLGPMFGIGPTDWDYLISFASNDRSDYERFIEVWKERYPDWAVKIQSNPHDFGGYLSIEVDREAYGADCFPKNSPEIAADQIADELGLET